MDNNIDAAVKWLSESDITNRDEQKPSFGGVNNGYFWNDKTYQYVYNEITGYAVNAFINMYKWLDIEKYLQYSKNAADYLIGQQAKDNNTFEYGAVPHSLTLPDLKNVSLLGRIVRLYDSNSFKRKDGTDGILQSVVIEDKTGSIRIVFWDEKAGELQRSNCKTGDPIRRPGWSASHQGRGGGYLDPYG